jgi:TRAP-type C4-dicarboxylate transport system substrate-binding protein
MITMNGLGRFARALPAVSLLLVAAFCALAEEPGGEWQLANEYPATSLPGEGDAFFAKLVAEKTRGKVAITPVPDAKLGFKSREQLAAVAEGKVAMADSFGGALAEGEPVFALASLPFLAADETQARSLLAAARPAYEAAFARHRQKLLYVTPWPASGIWSKAAIASAEDLAKLHIRTYDRTGTDLFARLGARASVVSFADLPAKLASGEIDAVLSSGDGGAGRRLWERLPHFTAIGYAIPLSFTTVNLGRWNALDAQTRHAIEDAAAQTEARQWKALEGRIEQNYARMRENGMSITTDVPAALKARLREAAKASTDEWAAKAGPEGATLLLRWSRTRPQE